MLRTSAWESADEKLGDVMSQPEEPDFQWLEDTIVALTAAVFTLVATVVTIFLELVFACFRGNKPPT
jgi:hypothetical protein